MINILSIEKLDNGFFRYVLNGDTANSVENIMNWLTIVAGKCHFKTSTGANLINEQDITYNNITLIDGATTIVPVSNSDLIDQLTALDFFSWIGSSGIATGVDRFEDLLDGFTFFGKSGQFARVNSSETSLEAFDIGEIPEASTDLSDMPSTISANLLLIGNATATGYDQINPIDLPLSTATQNAINDSIASNLESIDYPALTTDSVQDFELPTGKVAKFVTINGSIQVPETVNNTGRDDTFTQVDNIVTLKQETYTGYNITIYYQ